MSDLSNENTVKKVTFNNKPEEKEEENQIEEERIEVKTNEDEIDPMDNEIKVKYSLNKIKNLEVAKPIQQDFLCLIYL